MCKIWWGRVFGGWGGWCNSSGDCEGCEHCCSGGVWYWGGVVAEVVVEEEIVEEEVVEEEVVGEEVEEEVITKEVGMVNAVVLVEVEVFVERH